MSKSKSAFDRLATLREKGGRQPVTKAELDRLIADRKNDPPRPELRHPKPNWVLDPTDTRREHIRSREKRINTIEKRLSGSKGLAKKDFERSR